MEIIGQDKLKNEINMFDLTTFPRASIILGDEGSGKHLFANYISEKFDVPLQDITNKLSLEFIFSAALVTSPQIYVINCSEITVKEQNVILKFLEEPSENNIIILLSSNSGTLLPTVLNRCYHFKIAPYTEQELLSFTSDKTLLNYANTPGLILSLTNLDINAIDKLATTMITRIAGATIANTLTITNKLNVLKTDKDKIPPLVFLNILSSKLLLNYRSTDNDKFAEGYILVSKTLAELSILNVDKSRVIDRFLLKFRQIMKA